MTTGTPSRREVESLSWLVSRKIWASSLVVALVIVLFVGVVGTVLYNAPFVLGVTRSVTDPEAVLAVVLSARAIAFALAQVRRDRDVRHGALSVGNESSLLGMLTVAGFSVVGVLAAGVAMPLLVVVREQFTYLAIGIAALVLPLSLPLLVYQLGQRTAVDRYKRGFHVVPAVWHYLWTLPLLVLAWYLLLDYPPIPVSGVLARPFGVQTVLVDAWTLSYIAIWTPTALAFLYPVRWYIERALRFISPR